MCTFEETCKPYHQHVQSFTTLALEDRRCGEAGQVPLQASKSRQHILASCHYLFIPSVLSRTLTANLRRMPAVPNNSTHPVEPSRRGAYRQIPLNLLQRKPIQYDQRVKQLKSTVPASQSVSRVRELLSAARSMRQDIDTFTMSYTDSNIVRSTSVVKESASRTLVLARNGYGTPL